jgi:hypothetical protein
MAACKTALPIDSKNDLAAGATLESSSAGTRNSAGLHLGPALFL